MAQFVRPPTLDFGSGHDLMVHEFQPHGGLCADDADPTWDSLSPSLSTSPLLILSLSLSQNTLEKKKQEKFNFNVYLLNLYLLPFQHVICKIYRINYELCLYSFFWILLLTAHLSFD